jgi:hypothetical protein
MATATGTSPPAARQRGAAGDRGAWPRRPQAARPGEPDASHRPAHHGAPPLHGDARRLAGAATEHGA